MKRFLLYFCTLFAIFPVAEAHPYVPLTGYLPSAENVYLAQVTSINGIKISFIVTEVLRGKPASTLVLLPYPGQQDYSLKSEWLLVSTSEAATRNSVGFAMAGDCGWIPGAVIRNGNELFIKCGAFPSSGIVLDRSPDGAEGLTLKHFKDLLKKDPPKP